MQVSELFKKEIDRPINGVIKVGQDDDLSTRQELDEYVVTKELDKHFHAFFERHTTSLDRPTDKIGVWIAGFFGSGKSHFLKILAYLLENRVIGRERAFDFFNSDRINDPLLRANMQRSVNTPADVILFNIDSKADASSKAQKDSIVKVFQKVFDEKLGYFGASPAIAKFERQLDQQGEYLAFKNAFQVVNGSTWELGRDTWGFCQEQIIEALKISSGKGEVEANRLIDSFNQNIEITPEGFAKTVKDYLDRQGKHHQILFMVDEVGQYIGENSDLMLNLQTVVEDLGIYCQGRAWVVVTAQEAMEEITKNRLKGNDFSKIVGRFSTRLSLSSANTDEVIRLRLLDKGEVAHDCLIGMYSQKEAILRNQITFSQDCAELPSYRNAEDFAATYPFVPYQFKLLQKVFEKIRITGAAGKHLAMGERSLLDAFQIASISVSKSEIGVLVPFDRFYLAIEGFLDTSVKRVIAQAAENQQLQISDLDVLKTLFMIKYVDEVRANLDNLTTLSLSNIDEDRIALRDRLKASLDRLEHQTLIQREGELYIFLTQEEQDIGREIKSISIDPSEVTNQFCAIVWNTIFTDKKYRHDARHQYDFNKKLDDRLFHNQAYDFTLHIVTSYASRYQELQEDSACLMATQSGQEVLVRLPDDQRLITEVQELVKTDKYIRDKSRIGLSSSIQKILDLRGEQNSKRKQDLESILRSLIEQADVFACGNKVEMTTRTDARSLLMEGMHYLVDNVYQKLGYVEKPFPDEADVTNALIRDTEEQDLTGKLPNHAAHSEIQSYLADESRAYRKVYVRNAIDKFKGRPFGWAELDTLGAIAELINQGKISLSHTQGTVHIREKGLVAKLRSKAGMDGYLFRLMEEVDAASLKVARDLASDGLLETSPPNDFQKLHEEYIKSLGAQIQQLQSWLDLVDRESLTFKLPFTDELRSHLELLHKLLNMDSAASFFKAVKTDRDALETYIDDRDKLKSFFTNQLTVFKKAIADLKALEPDLHHLQDSMLLQRLNEAKQILAMTDPTREIPKLGMLLKPLQDTVREILQVQVAQVQQQSLKLRERVREYAVQAHSDVSDRLDLSIATVDLDRIDATANQSVSIDAAIARSSELANLYSTLINRIDQQAIAVQQQLQAAASRGESSQTSTGDRPNPEPLPIVKPIAVIRATSAVTKPILETEEEVKEYLNALGRAMMKEIKQGRRVRLE